jgi:hypothetical protein
MSTVQRVVVVAAVGAAYPIILTWLYAYGDYISLMSLAAARQFGSPATLRLSFSVISAVCWAVVVGLMFGVPFGLALRTQLFRYWLLFVVAGAASQLFAQLHAGLDFEFFVLEWSIPEVWLNLVAVLVIAYLVTLLFRPSRASAIAIAP